VAIEKIAYRRHASIVQSGEIGLDDRPRLGYLLRARGAAERHSQPHHAGKQAARSPDIADSRHCTASPANEPLTAERESSRAASRNRARRWNARALLSKTR